MNGGCYFQTFHARVSDPVGEGSGSNLLGEKNRSGFGLRRTELRSGSVDAKFRSGNEIVKKKLVVF